MSLLLISACSSINPKAIDQVQSVAFIGFDVDLRAESISQTQNSDQLARTVQNQVKESFAKELNWHVTENAKMANNFIYQGFYHQYKSEFLEGGLVEDSQLRQAEAARLTFEEREKLINILNVDALALMHISTPSRKEVMSHNLTTKFYEANIHFVLYEKGNEDSIWKTLKVTGISDIPFSYVVPEKRKEKPTTPENLTLTGMLNGEGLKNSIERMLSSENTPTLINKKFEIMQDAITVSMGNLIKQYKNEKNQQLP